MNLQSLEQLYLILASREESIFTIQIMENQIYQLSPELRNQFLISINKETIHLEQLRTQREETQLTMQHNKKMLGKVAKKLIKIQLFYNGKLSNSIPLLSQSSRNYLFRIVSDQSKSNKQILSDLLQQQKQRLQNALQNLYKGKTTIDERCNRNERFYQDPYIQLHYINKIHKTYYLKEQNTVSNKTNMYDILQIDDQSREIINGGYGFRSYVASVMRKDKPLEGSVFTSLESTYEIVLFRYDKIFKECSENNQHIQKSIKKYCNQYTKLLKMKTIRNSRYDSQNIVAKVDSTMCGGQDSPCFVNRAFIRSQQKFIQITDRNFLVNSIEQVGFRSNKFKAPVKFEKSATTTKQIRETAVSVAADYNSPKILQTECQTIKVTNINSQLRESLKKRVKSNHIFYISQNHQLGIQRDIQKEIQDRANRRKAGFSNMMLNGYKMKSIGYAPASSKNDNFKNYKD